MNIENLPYADRKFLVVVREPTLTDKIIDYGTWVLVPTALVRLGWKVYETVQQRHLPAMIQAMTGDMNTLVFPPGHPLIDTVYTAHPDADSPLYSVTSTFHRRLFEARVAEFARIMRCAGATKLAINAERKTESEAEAMAKLHIAMASVDPRVRVRRTSSTRLSISFRGGQGEVTELPSD